MLFITALAYREPYKIFKHTFMSVKRKRRVPEDKRVFNSKWKIDYFMIETAAHSMMCLICSQVVNTVKGDNEKQHFRRQNSDAFAKLKGKSRKICVENSKKSVRQQTSCLSTFIKSTNNRYEASYRVAYHLVVAWKPYSDGQLVKRCLIDVVKCIHPGTETDYSSVALSQTKISKEASSFSLAADESTDINNFAQQLVSAFVF